MKDTLTKRQYGIRFIGYGAKTKTYFSLNAFIRELMDEMIIKDYTFPLMNVLSCLIEAKEEKGNIEQAMKMCKILFYISELYQRHDSEMIREFYERHFDKEAIWY